MPMAMHTPYARKFTGEILQLKLYAHEKVYDRMLGYAQPLDWTYDPAEYFCPSPAGGVGDEQNCPADTPGLSG